MKYPMFSLALGAAVSLAAASASAATLDDVKAKGHIQCGVSQGVPGFSNPDDQNRWTGLDVDFCRAVAAAVFNDPEAVRFTPLTAKDRFTALQSGEVDILSRNTTWTLVRDTSLGLNFVGVNYYDGQGFMVPKKLNVKSAKELNCSTVCVQPGTTTELNLADYFRANNMKYEVVAFVGLDETFDHRRVRYALLVPLHRQAEPAPIRVCRVELEDHERVRDQAALAVLHRLQRHHPRRRRSDRSRRCHQDHRPARSPRVRSSVRAAAA